MCAVASVPESGTGALVVVSGVPTATLANGYHVWLFAGRMSESGGVVTPDSGGEIVATLGIDVPAFDRMELDQPLGASSPGGDVVIGGALR